MRRGEAPVRVSAAAAAAVRNGHPWVFREPGLDAPAGTVLRLAGPDGVVCGWGLTDRGDLALRVLGRGEPPDAPLSKVIAERITRADAFRWRLAPPDTDCWRVVAGEGDALPGLIVDRYGDLAVVRLYTAAWEPWLEGIVSAIASLGWPRSVFRRLGVRAVDGGDGGVALRGPTPPDAMVVTEYGMRLLVRPHVGQKTGLFLDQREHRALVRRWSAGRRVANLFAYNGGFSVAAALGGAAHVTTVDLAPEAVADARENFRLNDLDPTEHAFEVADVFDWAPRGTFDLLVVDPPSLSHDKKSGNATTRAYAKLHKRLGGAVSRDGLLATSSCTARLGLDAWRAAVREGLLPHGDWAWHWQSAEPPDHPVALGHDEGRYLKFALLRRI